MAVQTIDMRSSHSQPNTACPNEFHNDFGHTFLFPAFIEECQKNQKKSMGVVDVLKACLCKAGLPFDGSEALQLHACIFHQTFITNSPASTSGKDADSEANLSERDTLKFSSHDYFHILLNKELGWFKFYKQMLPYIKLQLVSEVVSRLEQFCSESTNTNVASTCPLAYVSLLASAVETMFNIIFDIMQDGMDTSHKSDEDMGGSSVKTNHGYTSDEDMGGSSVKTNHGYTSDEDMGGSSVKTNYGYASDVHSLCECLCQKISSCLEILLQWLDEESVHRHVIENDMTTLQCVVEIFSLTLLAVTPFCSIEETRVHFRQLWVEKVNLSNLFINDESVKNVKGKSEEKKLWKQVVMKPFGGANHSDEVRKQEGCKDITDGSLPANAECQVVHQSGIHSNDTTTEANLTEKNDVQSVCNENVVENANAKNEKSGSDSKTEFLFLSLRRAVPMKLFFKLVHYFSRGEDKIHKHFYKCFSLIIKDENHVRIADHFVSRKNLFQQVEELLSAVTTRESVLSDVGVEFDSESFSNFLDGLRIYPDRKLFSMTPAEEVLASRRQLCGEMDLELVKQAVEERMAGWLELLFVGIQNPDFENWWNKGFYDVVMEKEDFLSTETNVRGVLSVLNGLLQRQPVCWGNVARATELFTGMLCRLPTCLQERIILSWSASEESDWLPNMKEEEVVLREITTLLNRLTSETVHQLSSQVLVLCLYSTKCVLTQALHVAIYNKGQVEPVVQLLRQMPGICTLLDITSCQSLLMTCLRTVLSSTHFDETLEENFVKMLNLLTQGYHRLLDADSKTTQWNPDGVLSVEEVMRIIVLPVLDAQIFDNLEMKETDTDENKTTGNIILPFLTSLQCLSGLIQTVSADKLKCLHGVVLVQVLSSLCVQNWPSVSDGKEEGGWHRSIWQNARICLDGLIDRLSANGSLDLVSIQWVAKTSLTQGLPSLALIYPLVQQHSDLQMMAILELLVKELTLKSDYCILPTLLQLGQINDAMCHVVVQLLGADVMSSSHVSRQHLASVMAQTLSHSLASDMSRTCRMLTCVLSQAHIAKVEWEDAEEDLVSIINWKTLGPDCKTKCLCVLSLTNGLIWLLAGTEPVTTTQRATAVSSYQAAFQDLLKSEGSSPTTDQEKLLVLMISQCCSIMCLSQCGSQVFQRLHVLAMALLTNLSSSVKVNGGTKEEGIRQKVGMDESGGDGGGCDFNTNEGNESLILKDGGKEKRREWLNAECFLCLRDIVFCVQDDSIQTHLINQLKELWILVADT